jgi:hypothetical protein
MTPFPHPAHRTGHADLPHPALGQDFTPLLSRATPPAVSEHSSELIGCPISGFTLRAIPPRCHSGATPSRCPLAAPFNACGLVKIIDVVRNLSASCRWRSCALEVRPNSRLRRPWCPSTEECTGATFLPYSEGVSVVLVGSLADPIFAAFAGSIIG